MGSWFKGFVLGIAALLGLSSAGEPPAMSIRAFRDATTLYASAEIHQLPGRDLESLVEASFTVRLHATIWTDQTRVDAYRDIRYTGRNYEVMLSETGGVHTTGDANAAWIMASRFNMIPLGDIRAMHFPLAIGCKVGLSLPEDASYDPMVVWGYKPCTSYRELDSVGLVPYY
ncbi:MAG: hypothetical protein RBT62_05175 [Spirochaetia bacterium]|jgi:hypothetical protein|nr:hypothetical protein [Spirochaetia bacterium]